MKIVLFCIAIIWGLTSQCLAGTVFETVTRADDGSEWSGSISVQGGNLRMEVSNKRDDMAIIFRQTPAAIISVDHASKSYTLVDQSMMDEMSAQISSAKKQMEEALSGMPPEQRAMAERMMSGRMPQFADAVRPTIEVVELGEGESVNGYSTIRYQTISDGVPQQNFWVAGWDQIKGADELKLGALSMVQFMRSLTDAMPMMGQNFENPFEALDRLNGYPVRTEQLDDQGQVISTTELVSSATRTLDTDLFKPPAGYREQGIPSMR